MVETFEQKLHRVAEQISKETTIEGLREQCAILADMMLKLSKGVRHAIGFMQEYGCR